MGESNFKRSKEEEVLAKRLRLETFTNICDYWLENYEPDNPGFIRFRDYLDITDSDFRDIMTDKYPVLELVGLLKRRIEQVEGMHEWLILIDLWSYFSLGDDLSTYCAFAIEEAITEGNACRAAKIAVDNQLNRNLSSYAFRELARTQSDGCQPLHNTGIFPGHILLI